jgi:tryptophan synthase beta chain
MVRISFDQKPFRKLMMHVWGGNCVASPSTETVFGRSVLERDPNTPGSLGIAISEAIEQAVLRDDTRYSLGSVLNHVMLHQTIIGLEAKKQMAIAGDYPDVVIGCAGGGSNFAGLSFPYVHDKINGKDIDIIPVEPAACPTLTRGPFAYDHGDTAKMTPLLPMHTLGHDFVPEPIHAGGLRYHGMSPLVSNLVESGVLRPMAIHQTECYQAALKWARTEGFISAPETSHALAAVVAEAMKAKEEGKQKTILFNWSGHGLMDLVGYEKFMSGTLKDVEFSSEQMAKSLAAISNLPKPPGAHDGKSDPKKMY